MAIWVKQIGLPFKLQKDIEKCTMKGKQTKKHFGWTCINHIVQILPQKSKWQDDEWQIISTCLGLHFCEC